MKLLKNKTTFYFLAIVLWLSGPFFKLSADNLMDYEITSIVVLNENEIQISVEQVGQRVAEDFSWRLDDTGSYIYMSSIDRNNLLNQGYTTLTISGATSGSHIFNLRAEEGEINTTYDYSDFVFYWSFGSAVNSILTQSFQVPVLNDDPATIVNLSTAELHESKQYIDGLGRPIQSILIKGAPDEKDMVRTQKYSRLGRQDLNYLPYVSTNDDGTFTEINQSIIDQDNFYQTEPNIGNTSVAYYETLFDNSPLDRLVERGSPGVDWQIGSGHTSLTSYDNNDANQIRKWVFDPATNQYTGDEYYADNVLTKLEFTDENGNISISYTDNQGMEICKNVQIDASNWAYTYYIYDPYGNLKYNVSPEAYESMMANNEWEIPSASSDPWVTEYIYDAYNRIVEKHLPEGEPEYIIYDRLGRQVLVQDGVLRQEDKWKFTKYDIHNRIIITGIYFDPDPNRQTRSAMQDYVFSAVDNVTFQYYEIPDGANFETNLGYTDQAFPLISQCNECEIWETHYYDSYDFDLDGMDDHTFINDIDFPNNAQSTRLQGQLTGGKVRLLDGIVANGYFEGNASYNFCPASPNTLYYKGDQIVLLPGFQSNPGQTIYIGPNITVPPGLEMQKYVTHAVFFDKYARTIQTQSENHLGGTDIVNKELDFSGDLGKTKVEHNSAFGSIVNLTRYEYDHRNRLYRTYHQNNSDPEILAEENTYNRLGQLIEKNYHSTDFAGGTPTFLQSLDYAYNERGWLTEINNPDNLDQVGDDFDDIFAFRLLYNSGFSELGATARYDGTITGMVWQSDVDNQKRGFGYTYDAQEQLTSANFGEENNGNWNQNIGLYDLDINEIDLNGNIKSVSRSGPNGLIDNLTYYYSGNQLVGVNDAIASSGSALDFSDNNSIYNPNNPSNPEYEYDSNGSLKVDDNKGITNISYNYLNLPTVIEFASGDKIEWYYSATGEKLCKRVTIGGIESRTDYVGAYVYSNNSRDYFHFLDGRIRELGNSQRQYEYAILDHLKNVRVTFKADANGSPSLLQEAHFYPFGLELEGLGVINETEYPFLYNHKEISKELDLHWYDYGLRQYDPQLGRWHAVDPLEEFHSPYNYVGNNPIRYIDPDGASSTNTVETPTAEIKVPMYQGHPIVDGEEVIVTPIEETVWVKTLNGVQTALDIAGLIPGIGILPDLVNAGISLARGNWKDAGLSLFAAIPGIGDAAGAAKLIFKTAGVAATMVAVAKIKKAKKAGAFSEWVRKGNQNQNTLVYLRSLNGGANNYVGITRQGLKTRELQHSLFTNSVAKLSDLTRGNPINRKLARSIEQAIIHHNPNFLNRINSISPLRPFYRQSVRFGERWLQTNGYGNLLNSSRMIFK